MTALLLAAENGHDAVVKTLLERGAAVDHTETVGFAKCESICHLSIIIFLIGVYAGADRLKLTCRVRCLHW